MARPRMYTEQDYHDLAEERGFAWIGVFPQNVQGKTRWKCLRRKRGRNTICGHEWETTFSKIKNVGTGCPKCAGRDGYWAPGHPKVRFQNGNSKLATR